MACIYKVNNKINNKCYVGFNNMKKIVDQYGVMYDSAFAAAKEFGVSHQRIRKAVKIGSPIGGVLLHYKDGV